MTLQELKDLLKEGETLDEILALEGKTAKELLKEKSTVAIPIDVLNMALDEDFSKSQIEGLWRMIINFSLGNYDYMPVEKIPDYLRHDLKRFIEARNYSYLFCHILENLSEE